MFDTNNPSNDPSNSVVEWLNLFSLNTHQRFNNRFNLLRFVRCWLDSIEIDNPMFARLLSRVIPSQCPFERDIKLFGYKVAHIPPLCKLNPLYDQFVGLRFRALCYLVERCGEDIQSYA